MQMRITSGLLAWGIVSLLPLAGPSPADTVEIVYEDVPGAPARRDVTADGTSGLGGFLALIRQRRPYH